MVSFSVTELSLKTVKSTHFYFVEWAIVKGVNWNDSVVNGILMVEGAALYMKVAPAKVYNLNNKVNQKQIEI